MSETTAIVPADATTEKPRGHRPKLDKIRTAILEKDDSRLTERELQWKEQMTTAFKLLLTGEYTRRDVVNTLMEDHGVNNSVTAYARIRDAMQVYGDVASANRQVEALIAYQRAEEMWKRALTIMAGTKGEDGKVIAPDPVTMMEAMDRALKANEQMIKIRGVDRDQPNELDPAKFQPLPNQFILAKSVDQMVKAMLKAGVIDLNTILQNIPVAEVVPPTNGHATDE